jgi:hypothetical protein
MRAKGWVTKGSLSQVSKTTTTSEYGIDLVYAWGWSKRKVDRNENTHQRRGV